MNTYTVHFLSSAESAAHDLEAETPQQALDQARELYEDNPSALSFESYDTAQPVNRIFVRDAKGHEVAAWMDDEMRLRLAAQNLLEAAELVVARWERGDLAEAVRQLDAAIAEAKGGAP